MAPGKVRVNVIVVGGLGGTCGVQEDETKLVYVAPGKVRVKVSTDGAETGPIGTEHVAVVIVWTLCNVAVSVGPSLVETVVS